MNPKKPPRVDALGFALALIGIAFLVFGVYRAVRITVDALPLLIAGIAFCCAAVWQLTCIIHKGGKAAASSCQRG